jgi:hypothetical protein
MKYESTSDILVILVEATDDRTEIMQRLGYLGDQPKPVLVVLPGDVVLRRPGDLRELRYVIESQGHQSMLVILGNERLRLWAHRQGYSVFSSIETCVGALLQQGIVSLPRLLQEARLVDVPLSMDGEQAQLKAGGAGDRWEEGTQGETYSPSRGMGARQADAGYADAMNRVPTFPVAYLNSRRDAAGEEVAVWVANADNVVDRDTEPLRMRANERHTGGEHGGDKSGPYITRRLDTSGVMDLGYIDMGIDIPGKQGMRTFFVEDDMPSMPERGGEERGDEDGLVLPEWAQNGMAWGAQFDTGSWEQVREDKVLGAGVAAGMMRDRVLIVLILLLGIGIAGGVVFGSMLYR